MEKSEILTVLTKNLKQAIPDLKDVTLDPSKSMTDSGANSLDIVDVISSTMRELKVKIPREQLLDLKTIGGLVDALYAAQKKA
jgi:acyl carrier protein